MVHTQGYVVHNCGRGLVRGLGVAQAATVKIRGHVAYHVVLTRVIPIGYVARHAGITWEARRAGPGMQLSDLRAKERRFHATARQRGCAAGAYKRSAGSVPVQASKCDKPHAHQ